MATRSIRPRILSAVHQLGTFTISELCQVAGLDDRNQAYPQLKRLSDHGFLEDRTRPSEGRAHAPLKEYILLRDPETQKRFAAELAAYQPPVYNFPESDMAKVSLEEAERTLDRMDRTLKHIEREGESESENFPSLENKLKTVETNLEVARLEFQGTTKGQTPEIKKLNDRLESTRTRYKALKEEPFNEVSIAGFAPLLQTAASFVAQKNETDEMEGLRELVSPDLVSNYRAAFEVLVDELIANKEYPFEAIFRHALLMRDSDVVFDIVQKFRGVDVRWGFNRENACFLKTARLRTGKWLTAFEKLRAQMPTREEIKFIVYSYDAEHLTEDVYLDLTRGKRLSLVTPHAIKFLGMSQIIKPTLGIEYRNVVNSFDCSFLDPEESFHAYGPIANDVMLWQGAPRLRVAAILGMWGLPLKSYLKRILDSLAKQRGLLIVQGDVEPIAKATVHKLHMEEIGEHTTG